MIIPQNTVLKATTNSALILNAIRNSASETYQNQVPIAIYGDYQNLKNIGDAILGNPTNYNEFVNTLMNRIGKVLISSKLYENPWAFFKRGMMELGETIEEVFVDLLEAHEFDEETAEKEIFKRELPNVLSVFHILNYKKFYKVTINETQLKQAFISWQGVTDLISKIIETLYTSANYDEFLVMKYMLANAIIKGNVAPVEIPTISKETASDIVTSIKQVSNAYTFLTREYNSMGVATHTPKTEQYLITNSNFDAIMDVEVLASAFNMEKADFVGHKVLLDSFLLSDSEMERLKKLLSTGTNSTFTDFTKEEKEILANVPAMLVDKDFFMIVDNYQNMTEQYNGEGLYWNYWFHKWNTFSTSPFANATVFSGVKGEINSLEISPTSAELSLGGKLQLNVTMETSGIVSQGVTFAIEEETNSTIDKNGLLTIAKDEENETLTIIATSVYDATKTAKATITIK